MTKLVSVIMPLYNCQKYVEETVYSVLNQTYANIELIIIEDHSQDNSLELVKKISQKEERVKVYQNKDKGVSSARNYGIELSKGKYIMFLDSDDTLEPNCIQRCVELMEYHKVDIVKFNFRKRFKRFKIDNNFLFPNMTIISCKNDFVNKIFPLFLKSYSLNNVWGQLISKEILKKVSFDTDLIMGEDLKFNIHLYKKCNQILFLDEIYLNYRYNAGSTTRSIQSQIIDKRISDVIDAYFELYRVAKEFKVDNISTKQEICDRLFKEVIDNFIALLDDQNLTDQDLKERYKRILGRKEITSFQHDQLQLIESAEEFIKKCKKERNKNKIRTTIKRIILR